MTDPTLPGLDEDDAPPPAGHNNPPPYDEAALEKTKSTVDKFLAAADVWRKTEITSEKMAGQLGDMITGLRELGAQVEAERKAAKKPHDDAGKAVQAVYVPMTDRVDRALDTCLKRLKVYVDKRKAEDEAKRQKEIAEAAEAERLAKLAAMDAAQTGSVEDEARAAEQAKEAEAKAKAAAKPVSGGVKSASGGGRTVAERSRMTVEIDRKRLSSLFLHYQHDHEVFEVLQKLANREANSAAFPKDGSGNIPACTITKTTSLA
jgi:hypothetical protein